MQVDQPGGIVLAGLLREQTRPKESMLEQTVMIVLTTRNWTDSPEGVNAQRWSKLEPCATADPPEGVRMPEQIRPKGSMLDA